MLWMSLSVRAIAIRSPGLVKKTVMVVATVVSEVKNFVVSLLLWWNQI